MHGGSHKTLKAISGPRDQGSFDKEKNYFRSFFGSNTLYGSTRHKQTRCNDVRFDIWI